MRIRAQNKSPKLPKRDIDKGVSGGVALLNAIEAIKDLKDEDLDINTGINIVRRALEEPMRQLASNAGKVGAVIINDVRRRRSEGGFMGYNVMTETYEDMLESGIIDPAKVRAAPCKMRLPSRP